MSESLEVGIAGATTKQLLRANLRETRALKKLIETLITVTQEGNTNMADIEASVDRLQVEVQGVKDRLSGVVEPLKQAIKDYQDAAAAAAAADEAEDADYEAKIAARDQALADLQAVVDEQSTQIDQASDDLSKIGVDEA